MYFQKLIDGHLSDVVRTRVYLLVENETNGPAVCYGLGAICLIVLHQLEKSWVQWRATCIEARVAITELISKRIGGSYYLMVFLDT